MARIILIHWHAAEAVERAKALRVAGHEADVLTPNGAAGLRPLGTAPPDVFVVDLSRLPSQGRAVALELRRQKGTRRVPIVFAGGEPEKVARTRELLPDAVYAEWEGIGAALARALANPPAAPVVPGTMAGYAGTPLVKKLGIKEGATVVLMGAPEGFEAQLAGVPEGVRLRRQARGPAATVLLFVRSQAELERRFAAAARVLDQRGGLWVIWPKKSASVPGDVTQAGVRAYGLAAGFVDYKICAVDETWSGLLFAVRRSGSRGSAT